MADWILLTKKKMEWCKPCRVVFQITAMVKLVWPVLACHMRAPKGNVTSTCRQGSTSSGRHADKHTRLPPSRILIDHYNQDHNSHAARRTNIHKHWTLMLQDKQASGEIKQDIFLLSMIKIPNLCATLTTGVARMHAPAHTHTNTKHLSAMHIYSLWEYNTKISATHQCCICRICISYINPVTNKNKRTIL